MVTPPKEFDGVFTNAVLAQETIEQDLHAAWDASDLAAKKLASKQHGKEIEAMETDKE